MGLMQERVDIEDASWTSFIFSFGLSSRLSVSSRSVNGPNFHCACSGWPGNAERKGSGASPPAPHGFFRGQDAPVIGTDQSLQDGLGMQARHLRFGFYYLSVGAGFLN
jgi:hypothetical protein